MEHKDDPDHPPNSTNVRKWATHLLWLLIGMCGIIIYYPSLFYGFLRYDDRLYITLNEHVLSGMTAKSFIWAITTSKFFFHPLTWFSLQIDATMYGTSGYGFHITNLCLHFATTVLANRVARSVFYLSHSSALFVALLYLIHPINVESTVWISERKGLLATTFLFASLIIYSRAGLERAILASRKGYFISIATLAAGMLSKPSIVFAPLLMFAISFHARTFTPQPASIQQLIKRLLPFFATTVFLGGVNVSAANSSGGLNWAQPLPIDQYFVRSFEIASKYIEIFFTLTPPAPFTQEIHASLWAKALLLTWLVAATASALIKSSRSSCKPALCLAWLILTLLPVLGFFNIGSQLICARYCRIPMLGIECMIFWQLSAISGRLRVLYPIASAILITGAAGRANREVSYWANDYELFTMASRRNPSSPKVWYNLYYEYTINGSPLMSEYCLRKYIILDPENQDAKRSLKNLFINKRSAAD